MKRTLAAVLSLVLILVGLAIPVSAATAPKVEKTITFGGTEWDCFFSVAAASDGGFVSVGGSSSTDGDMKGLNKGIENSDAIIVKYDKNGSVQWKKSFGGKDTDSFNSVAAASDGGFVAVGESVSSDGDMKERVAGTGSAIIVKYDKNGNVQWKKSFGGTDDDSFNSVAATSDGGFVAVGDSWSSNGDMKGLSKGAADAIVIKYDKSGKLQWKKSFGGKGLDCFYSVVAASDGGFVALGQSSSSDGDVKGLDRGSSDAIIVKYDKSGNVKWKKVFGGKSGDYLGSVAVLSDGGFVALGLSDSIDGDMKGISKSGVTSLVAVKYDKNGNLKDKKNLGSANWDSNYSIAAASDGGFVVFTGLVKGSKESGLIVKYNSSFNEYWRVVWDKNLADLFVDGACLKDGSIVAAGGFVKTGGNGADAVIVKLAKEKKATAPTTTATTGTISMKINYAKALVKGKLVAIDSAGTKPIIKDGKTLIPMRFAGEKLGATVKWDQATKTVTLKRGSTTLTLKIGSSTMTKAVTSGGKTTKTSIKLAAPAQLIGGKTLVPIRAVANGFGFDVRYDNATKIIVVCNKKMSEAEYKTNLNDAKAKFK